MSVFASVVPDNIKTDPIEIGKLLLEQRGDIAQCSYSVVHAVGKALCLECQLLINLIFVHRFRFVGNAEDMLRTAKLQLFVVILTQRHVFCGMLYHFV